MVYMIKQYMYMCVRNEGVVSIVITCMVNWQYLPYIKLTSSMIG